MSVNDPVYILWDDKRGGYRLQRGRETFYNSKREMIIFDTDLDAENWSRSCLGVVPVRDLDSIKPDPPLSPIDGQIGFDL